ncbi:hypothetical protein [Micromonospora sp. SL4-19]|uniref:hypothetical protein n=1 Tax=Micromonospora sp. SL4-19 TaxID=3399129 RepID=UPI003A4DB5FA
MPELEAFFGCMSYAALRPEEVLHLREDEDELPAQRAGVGRAAPDRLDGGRGPGVGDGNDTAEDRGLKHRARAATRDAPVPPALVRLLDHHPHLLAGDDHP